MTDKTSSAKGRVSALSIIVSDAGAAAREVAGQFGWTLGELNDVNFADVHAPGIDLWFSTSAPVPSGQIDGLTIHVFVEDVDTAAQAALGQGAKILFGPADQDFGMRTALFQGPGNLFIDLTCPI